MTLWADLLRPQYVDLTPRFSDQYPKSHWEGCDWGNRVTLPEEAPAEYISCNACLRRQGYIVVLPCNPLVVGWPHAWRKCDLCDYGGVDCETWARVRGCGEAVETVLATIDPSIIHPVTWDDLGLVPFGNSLFLPTKAEMDRFMADLEGKYPGHFIEGADPCECWEQFIG